MYRQGKRRKIFAFKFVRPKNRYPLKVSPNFSLENLRQNFGFRLCRAQILFNLKFITMETKTRTSNRSSKGSTTENKQVKEKLTAESKSSAANGANSKTVANGQKTQTPKAVINLDDRIQKFEKLRGLANNRELLVGKLNKLTKFNYNHDGSSQFTLRDSNGLEFKTTNTNFIHLVTSKLQETLENRKQELEEQILQFEL